MGFARALALAFSTPLTSLSPQMPMPPPPACDLEAARPSPRDFLACRDPGPYTCLRGRGLELLDFDFHLKRLEHAIGSGGISAGAGALRGQVLGSIEESLGPLLEEHGGGSAKEPLDTFVTVHVSMDGESLAVSSHAVPMPFVGVAMPGAVGVEVMGEGPRPNPTVKHSQWLWDRRELEQHKPGAGGEVLLFNRDGKGGVRLLEGLVTNLIVVRDSCLYTAPQSDVLPGHVRTLVCRAAEALGLSLREESPSLQEANTWQEAFLTGSGRLMVPVRRITASSLGFAAVDLPEAPGPVTYEVRQRVLYDMDALWEPIAALKKR